MKIDEQVAYTETAILNSHLFRSKPQMKRLLRYLIKHTYQNNNVGLQQRSIAVDCLGRNEDFDSAKDPIVRIEAARLRKLLDTFYEQEAFTPPPYRISLPKGSYRLSFSRSLENKISSGLGLLLICQSPQFASEKALQLMLRIRRDLSLKLSSFRHVKLSVDFSAEGQVAERGAIHFLAEEQHDYVLRIEVVGNPKNGDYLLSSIAIHRSSQEILWSQSSELSAEYRREDIELFYKRLISPLIADAYGLLGKHWAGVHLKNGVDYTPEYQLSYVYYIAMCNEPTIEISFEFLDFLEGRLERFPEDYVAKAGYLALGFFDFFLNYNLIQDDYNVRLQHALEVAKYYPSDAGCSLLVGFCYFLLSDYEQAKLHLNLAKSLNSDNTFWDFIYACVLFFIGEKEQGVGVLKEIRRYNSSPPGYYLIPEFFDNLEKGESERAFMLGSKVSFADDLEYLVKALAYQEVGAEQLAVAQLAKVSVSGLGQRRASWIESKIFENLPVLRSKILGMLKCLSSV